MLTQIALHTHLQRHLAGWTPDAGPVETDVDDAIRRDLDEFQVPPVGLDGRTDQFDHAMDTLEQVPSVGR